MGRSMRGCITEEPEMMRRVVREVPGDVEAFYAAYGRQFEQIILVGSGSSLNAAVAGKYAFERYAPDKEVALCTPFEFMHYYPRKRVSERTLVVGMTQTARSVLTVRCLQEAISCGGTAVVVNGRMDEARKNCGDLPLLDIRAGDEFIGPKTKGVVATVATLLYLAAGLSRGPIDLSGMPDALEKVIARTDEQLPAVLEAFLPAGSLTIIGYGPTMSCALEGRLKILETVRCPVDCFDVEEYLHGPYHCLNEDSRFIFVAPAGAGQSRIFDLIRYVQRHTRHILLLCSEGSTPPEGVPVIRLPDSGGEEVFGAVPYVVPLQILSDAWTRAKGRHPEISAHPDFHDALNSKFHTAIVNHTGEEEPLTMR